jgi:hypothetical protein
VIPAEALEAISDPDIREVLKEMLADRIEPERRPGPEEIAGLVRGCVDELKVLPGVELFGDRREALHGALTELLRQWFFERRSLLQESGRQVLPPRSGSLAIDLCVDLLRSRGFAEISATEDVIAGAFRRALAASLPDTSMESLFRALAIEPLPQHALEDPLQKLVRRVLDWFRGDGGGPPSGPGAGPPAVPA